MDDILIIGGGFAGLAAGVSLAQAGRKVRLLEQKPYLGGRARSFHYRPTNSIVDNGQHIFMGCYHSTLRFLDTIGTLHRILFQPHLEVHFAGKGEGVTSISFPPLPAPLHLIVGTLSSSSFTLREKLQILRLGRALRSSACGAGVDGFHQLTVDQWLASLGQSNRLRRIFWDLLCIAALNEDPRIAAASVFEPVLRLALFRSPKDSRIGLASAGLSECYTGAAADFLRKHHGTVELGKSVTGLLIAGSGSATVCEGVRLSDGSVIKANAVVSATPPFQFLELFREDPARLPAPFVQLKALRPAPIISINLWFDRALTDLDFVGLRGTTVQWLFNRARLLGTGDGHVSLVISGAHEHIHREKDELIALALKELKELFPLVKEARLVHSLVIKERLATFSPTVDSVSLRPPAITPFKGLFLAGDWTQTGLPATIESAVQSGYTASSEITKAL